MRRAAVTVKTTGAEFLAYYNDSTAWPDGQYHEAETISINGMEIAESADMEAMIKPDDRVTLSGGSILDSPREWRSMEAHFKDWRRRQNTETFLVTADLSAVEAVKSAVKASGGKIIK